MSVAATLFKTTDSNPSISPFIEVIGFDSNHQVNTNSYLHLKALEQKFALLNIQEYFIKHDIKQVKTEMLQSKQEIQKTQSTPLLIGQFIQMIDENYAIVDATDGRRYYARVASILNRDALKPYASVALHKDGHSIVDILPSEATTHNINQMIVTEKPTVTFSDIGGLDTQKQEIKEIVELPLSHPHLFKQLGIEPARGLLLYGLPGTGKTMMVKAIANSTNATFYSVCGSEFIQKYGGDGPKMVRDLFKLAQENSPSILFIDECDAFATKRFDSKSGADRQVQRILNECLTQMDGFDQNANVIVIMATNRVDVLDPALLRPGRLDRKIYFPLPDRRQKRLIFQTCTDKMNLSDDINLEEFSSKNDKISAAQIAAICQEAGMNAVRHNRYVVKMEDLNSAYSKTVRKNEDILPFYKGTM